MKKKITALLLALVLVLSISACGQQKTETGPEKTAEDTTQVTLNSEDIQQPEVAPADDAAENTDESQDTGFKRGVVEANTYTSELLGIKMTASEDWIIANDEQLAEISGMVPEMFEDEEVSKTLENSGVIYDLYAINGNTAESVNINVQKLGVIGGLVVTEDAYADETIKQLPDMISSSGITITSLEKVTVSFGGSDHVAIKAQGTMEEMEIFETIVLIKSGSFMACVTTSSFIEDTTDNIIAMFSGI